MPELPDYLDFDVEIAPGAGRDYPVRVDSPAGQARLTMRFPFDDLALENRLLKLQNALLQSGGRRRQVPSADERAVQEFGAALFDALFTGEARSRYDVCREQARSQAKEGLRLNLRIQPPELACLPWEFLFDPRRDDYLCLAAGTPIVRYPDLPQSVPPLAVIPPLRILAMIADPLDLEPLEVEVEKARLERALEGLRARRLVELAWLPGQTWRDLQAALRRERWHVFHFIGHGGFDESRDEGLLALCDEAGYAHRVHAAALGRLLCDRSLRLALLNACEGARGSRRDIFSSTAAILVRRGLPAALAMQYAITDAAAIEFARSFYEALADGLPVEAAATEGRKAVNVGVNNSLEWGAPVLYLRAQEGRLFDWLPAPPAHAVPAAPGQPEPTPAASPEPAASPAPPGPRLDLTASPNPAPAGSPVTWTAAVHNPGGVPCGPFSLLRGLSLLNEEEFELPPGGQRVFTFQAAYPAPGEYREAVRLLGGAPCSAEAAVTVFQPPELSLELRPAPARVLPDEPVRWQAALRNTGGVDLRQVLVRCGREALAEPFDLPAGAGRELAFERRYAAPGEGREEALAAAFTPAGERLARRASGVVVVRDPRITIAGDELRLALAPGIELALARIPAGEFLMGSDQAKDTDAYEDETPQHRLRLEEYWIGKYPVTNAQFAVYAQAAHKPFTAPAGKEDHPVVNVPWSEAAAFCEWAATVTGQPVRLPSEAEWEKAARGGEGRLYPWGEAPPDKNRCNLENWFGGTTPVGRFSPQGDSPDGCADMAGNVWEWTRSLYQPYPYRPNDGREDPQAQGPRVLRGGSFRIHRRFARCACRYWDFPYDWYVDLGFRVGWVSPISISGL